MVEHNCKDIVVDLKWMMSLVGLWPDKESNKCLLLTKKVITFFFSFSILALNSIETVKVYKNYVDMAGVMYIMMSITSYVIKLVLFQYNHETFASIVDDIGSEMFNFEFEPREQILKKTIKITNIMGRTYRTLVSCWFVFFIAFPIVDNKPLPMPLSYELGIYRIPMYIFQVVGMIIIGWVNIGFDLLLPALMSITSSQIDILKKRLSSSLKSMNMENDQGHIDNVGLRRFLSDCVKQHLFISRFAEKINKTFAIVILLQYLCAIFVFCNSLFQVMMIDMFSSQFLQVIIYLGIILQELSMYCWFGNDVMLKSFELLDSCYHSEWYKFNVSNKRMLLIIMEIVKKPIVIKAYKFSTASLPTLMKIMKWSYSAYALLQNMYAKK